MEWYEFSESDRIKEVYAKYTIADFFDWWSSNKNKWMEVRIKNIQIIKDVSKALELPHSPSGVYVNNSYDLKKVIAFVREKATCWMGVNPRKKNYNKWGNISLGGRLINIESIDFLLIDIDRTIKNGPATKDELKNADILANLIIDKLSKQNWANNYCKICSGNGVQLLIKLDIPIVMPTLIFDNKTKTYDINRQFEQYCSLLRDGIGKQLKKFSEKYIKELSVDVDKAGFNIASVSALPVTKNYKYKGFTWRGVIEIVDKGKNDGLTDYIMQYKKENLPEVISIKMPNINDKLIAGKLRDHPLVKFMLQKLPTGERNNKLWFQLKCLIRDSNISINSDEFISLHHEIEQMWEDQLSLNVPERKYVFSRNTVNGYCIDNLMPLVYEYKEKFHKKLDMKLENLPYDKVSKISLVKDLPSETIFDEDCDEFKNSLEEGNFMNIEKYIAFVNGIKNKYGEEKAKYFCDTIFYRMFSYI